MQTVLGWIPANFGLLEFRVQLLWAEALVLLQTAEILGWLPANLAAHLAPAIIDGELLAAATVIGTPAKKTSNLKLELQVISHFSWKVSGWRSLRQSTTVHMQAPDQHQYCHTTLTA